MERPNGLQRVRTAERLRLQDHSLVRVRRPPVLRVRDHPPRWAEAAESPQGAQPVHHTRRQQRASGRHPLGSRLLGPLQAGLRPRRARHLGWSVSADSARQLQRIHLAGAGRRRRDLLCGLFIKLIDSEHDAHAVLRVVRMADRNVHFGADSTLLASNDVEGVTHGDLVAGARWQQHPAAHEVGHLLGLHHVAWKSAACRSDVLKCYGSNLVEKLNVMGTGDQLSLDNAQPWRDRITAHTGVDADLWKVDWASAAAELWGTESFERIPKPGLIDI